MLICLFIYLHIYMFIHLLIHKSIFWLLHLLLLLLLLEEHFSVWSVGLFMIQLNSNFSSQNLLYVAILNAREVGDFPSSYLILSYLVLSYSILSYLILSYLILSYSFLNTSPSSNKISYFSLSSLFLRFLLILTFHRFFLSAFTPLFNSFLIVLNWIELYLIQQNHSISDENKFSSLLV